MPRSITLIGPGIQASLQAELAEAAKDPALRPLLNGSGADLLSRFARYHDYLSQLPRRARRAMQRRWKRSLPALALLLALGQAAPALAATIAVNGSTCTLIDAITAANSDTATGGCRAGNGADVLNLVPKSTHTLTQVNNIDKAYGVSVFYSNNGLPIIASDITIEGHGSTIKRRTDAPGFRIFSVHAGGDLTLNETTVSGGKGVGAGIFIDHGALTLTNSTVSGNIGSSVDIYSGGRIHLINSTISGNDGSGIFSYYGSVTLSNSTVRGNQSHGVFMEYGFLGLTNSTVSGNNGFGVGTSYTTVNLKNSTVSSNAGDGINLSLVSTATLTHSTVTGNRAGIIGRDAELFLSHTLVSGNTNREIDLISGDIDADNFNLFGHSGFTNAQAFSGFTPGPSDITATSDGTNPTALNRILKPALTLSGGKTQTHNLVKGSPAVDAVTTGCPPPATDQRGAPRPQGSACDIGAVEQVLCNGQVATRVGTAANDVLKGTARRDIIHGLGGNDQLFGFGGSDLLCGGNGKDRLLGGPGNDTLLGQSGDDTLDGGGGIDGCNGSSGADTAVRCESVLNVP